MADEERIETVLTRGDEKPAQGPQNAKERVYEKLRMPLWLLDSILVLLGVALVVCLILGAIKGNAPAA